MRGFKTYFVTICPKFVPSMSSCKLFKEIFTPLKLQNLQIFFISPKCLPSVNYILFSFFFYFGDLQTSSLIKCKMAENWINLPNICIVIEMVVQKNWYSYLWIQKIIHDHPPICAQWPKLNILGKMCSNLTCVYPVHLHNFSHKGVEFSC